MVKKNSKNNKSKKLDGIYHKKKIPKKVKEEVWFTIFGKIYESKCYISWCSNKINVFNYHVGHDIPESKGGTDEINNLKPICDRCNLSMGHNYTIKEWNYKFNKSTNIETKFINDKNDIKYYNFYKYISFSVFIYLCFNNFEYINKNISNTLKNNIIGEKNIIYNLNYFANSFIKNISYYFYN